MFWVPPGQSSPPTRKSSFVQLRDRHREGVVLAQRTEARSFIRAEQADDLHPRASEGLPEHRDGRETCRVRVDERPPEAVPVKRKEPVLRGEEEPPGIEGEVVQPDDPVRGLGPSVSTLKGWANSNT